MICNNRLVVRSEIKEYMYVFEQNAVETAAISSGDFTDFGRPTSFQGIADHVIPKFFVQFKTVF